MEHLSVISITADDKNIQIRRLMAPDFLWAYKTNSAKEKHNARH